MSWKNEKQRHALSSKGIKTKHISLPCIRRFNGEAYKIYTEKYYKDEADVAAKKLREKGNKVRIISNRNGTKFYIYVKPRYKEVFMSKGEGVNPDVLMYLDGKFIYKNGSTDNEEIIDDPYYFIEQKLIEYEFGDEKEIEEEAEEIVKQTKMYRSCEF